MFKSFEKVYAFHQGGGSMKFWYGRRDGVRFFVRRCDTPFGKTYGLTACLGAEETQVPDISPEKREVRRLARACARAGLAPCHLRDAAEDWLADIR